MENSVKIALPKGRLAKQVLQLFKEFGYPVQIDSSSRKLIIVDEVTNFTFMFVKPSDVITYVYEGVCDIGVVGKDNLLEENKAVYELVDLNIGRCQMVVAGMDQEVYNSKKELRVATKYPVIAKKYFEEKNRKVNIIELKGSVELGPLVGLSDVIVDIYETGATLKANGLNVFDFFLDISARLIANQYSYRTMYDQINTLRMAFKR